MFSNGDLSGRLPPSPRLVSRPRLVFAPAPATTEANDNGEGRGVGAPKPPCRMIGMPRKEFNILMRFRGYEWP